MKCIFFTYYQNKLILKSQIYFFVFYIIPFYSAVTFCIFILNNIHIHVCEFLFNYCFNKKFFSLK